MQNTPDSPGGSELDPPRPTLWRAPTRWAGPRLSTIRTELYYGRLHGYLFPVWVKSDCQARPLWFLCDREIPNGIQLPSAHYRCVRVRSRPYCVGARRRDPPRDTCRQAIRNDPHMSLAPPVVRANWESVLSMRT